MKNIEAANLEKYKSITLEQLEHWLWILFIRKKKMLLQQKNYTMLYKKE